VIDLKREHQRALQARTLLGHFQNLLGYILSLYCIYRWALSAVQRQLGKAVWTPAWSAAVHGLAVDCDSQSGRGPLAP
jgi:hypothetical protein